MPQSDDVGGAPLDFEAWRALLRSNWGRDVEVAAPNAFAGWMRPLNACGLEAASVKIRWGSADLGCSDQRVERSYRDVRCDGADHYLILFQVAGQTAMTQIDQAAQLACRRCCARRCGAAGDIFLSVQPTVADASAAAKIGAVSPWIRAARWC